MIALRLVIDTNILVSAALQPDGLQRTVFRLAITKPARVYVSSVVLDEYREVLRRKELQIRKGLQQQLLQLVRNRTYPVTPSLSIHMTKDPDDSKFLECTDAAGADYLVTGNSRHYPRFWKKTKVITPCEFINIVAPHLVR